MEVTATKATFQKYPAYKESGVEWLGEIPDNWTLGKLGTLLKPVSIKGQPDLPLLSITRELGVIERNLDEDEGNHNFIPDDLSGYKVIRKGQFGMNKMKAWQGSYGISRFTGIVSPAYYIFDFTSEIDPRFFHFAIRSKNYVAFFGRASDGVRIGQWDLSKSRMKEIPFFIPTPSEQTAIANFLDDKTAKIDRAIAQKEQLIALLKERKQIIIQNAVTKGLDPNVKLKDSGVEWIGEIPEDWEVKRLKYMVKMIGGYAFNSMDFRDSGVQIIKIANTYQNRLALERQPTFVPNSYLDSHKQWIIEKGDVLMSLTGTMGKTDYGFAIKVSSDEKFLLNQRVARLTPLKGIDADYLVLLLQSDVYLRKLYSLPSGTKQANLSNEDVIGISVPVPPKVEMVQILTFIENHSTKIDQAISLQQTQIEKLKEYKATLIDSAVTGKIKVS